MGWDGACHQHLATHSAQHLSSWEYGALPWTPSKAGWEEAMCWPELDKQGEGWQVGSPGGLSSAESW